MRDLTTQELGFVYGAGGCGRSSCTPPARSCGSGSRGNSSSKCKGSKSKSKCNSGKSKRKGC
ncbi:MAG TPA: hypothetical protein VGD66_05635 [Allosphingosinicella sp.]